MVTEEEMDVVETDIRKAEVDTEVGTNTGRETHTQRNDTEMEERKKHGEIHQKKELYEGKTGPRERAREK